MKIVANHCQLLVLLLLKKTAVLTLGFWKDNLKLRLLEDNVVCKNESACLCKGIIANISVKRQWKYYSSEKDSSVNLIYWWLDLYLLRFLFCFILLFWKVAQGLEFSEESQGVFHGCEFASTAIHMFKNLSKALAIFFQHFTVFF